MNNAAAINAVNHALAQYRRRQAHTPTNHSAREIAQASMLAEYLHDTHSPDVEHRNVQPHLAPCDDSVIASAVA